jgi:hypothetical protein
MEVRLKPFVTTGMALVGTGVIAVSPIAAMQPNAAFGSAERAITTMAVEPAGFVEDLLTDVSALSTAAGTTAEILIGAVGRLPTYTVTSLAADLKDPASMPSVLSALTYLTFSPDSIDAIAPFGPDSLVRLIENDALPAMTASLPPALQHDLANAEATFNRMARDLLGLLPDPATGFVDLPPAYFGLPPRIYQAINDLGNLGQSGIGQAAFNAANWSGAILPPLVVANLSAAVANPAHLPGLLSAFAYALVNPAPSVIYGLPSLYSSLTPIVQELISSAAAPFGGPTGLIANTADTVNRVLRNALGLLPHPIVDLPTTARPQVKAVGSTVGAAAAAGPAAVNVTSHDNTLGHPAHKAGQPTSTAGGPTSASTHAGKSGGARSGGHTGGHAKNG